MYNFNYRQVLALLLKAGFTLQEIGQLARLRGKYAASELDQAPVQQHHLEFARWLVTHQRLTDQLDAHQPAGE